MKKAAYKWHEHMTLGILYLVISLMVWFNGFSKLTSFFVKNGHIEGGATRDKGMIAFFSLIENGWWKYLIVTLFFYLAFDSIKVGVIKYKNKAK